MSTTRWDPWREIVTLRDAMNTLMEDSLTGPKSGIAAMTGSIPVDVKETTQEYVVIASLPGVATEDVEISILGDEVHIVAQVPDVDDEEDVRWLARERRTGQFKRSITLPVPVSSERATAEFDAGILTIHLPKMEESRAKKIQVKARGVE